MSQNPIPELFRQRIQAAKEQQLEELDLSGYWDDGKDQNQQQQLTRIPDAVFELTHLKRLDLSKNRLTTLPDSLGNLSNLTELDLSYNRLTDPPESISKLSHLTKLDLNSNRLNNLPEFISNFSNLTGLYLSHNQLSNLPEFISNLSDLTRLYLNSNQLSNLPDSIGKLSNLTELDLSYNRLTDLPKSISKLSNLTKLHLNSNRLNNLPESISNLSSLTRLDLGENQLSTLPDSFSNFSNLIGLSLRRNRLSILPDSIIELRSLERLYLNYNRLTTLPESLANLSNLTRLDLTGNPLETPPIEIANKGIEAIREYFRQLKEEGTDYIYEAKLLIVGEAGAGKTTLAKKIEDPNYELNNDEETTKGIDVTTWSFPLDNEREFKVNIWDFGGQAIYHATHQFFLTKRSLYALVADTRQENTDFYYWLNIVELLSDNSPLLIIKNEKQDRKREINERALRGQFTNLQETLATNLKTNRNLEQILSKIQHYIQDLPIVGQELPKTWVQVRKSLEDEPRNYISLQEYLDICETNGFTCLEDKLQLSGYLHDLGVCLHFQDRENSLLYKTVILKPEWVTTAVYRVLDNPKVKEQYGCFNTDDLKGIWQEEQYNDMRGELLQLMIKFELCYQIPNQQDTFIAPQLLSDNQPDYDWDESNNLILRYTYPDFMPKGIISRFIVIMHQYIDQQKYVWKTGVILNKDNTKAKIIENYGKREIRIRVAGQLKRDLMTQVTYELDKINDSFHKLNYQKLISCNCSTCIEHQNPYGYDFNNLLERISNQKYTIECNKKPYHEVQIFSLIDDAIDIKQLISQTQQDNNRGINIQGDGQQVILQLRDFIHTNQSRNTNISGNAQVTASGSGAFNQGNNQGTIANKINQNNFQQTKESKLVKILGIVAALATIIALFFNGIFNTEVRQWFDNLF